MAYKYLPLREGTECEIRLLTLLPGSGDSAIECTVDHALLEPPPPYEALSYTWGNPWSNARDVPSNIDVHSIHSVRLNGKPTNIGYNLHAALLRLRYPDKKRALWVDALCIDQANDNEKSKQVRQMHKIYNRANRVLSWLGEEDFHSNLAFDIMEELCWAIKVLLWCRTAQRMSLPIIHISEDNVVDEFQRLLPLYHQENIDLRKSLNLIKTEFLENKDVAEIATLTFGDARSLARYIVCDTGQLSEYPLLPLTIQAIQKTFSSRTYWERLWVVQEFGHGRDGVIVCGGREMDFALLTMSILFLGSRSVHTGSCLFWENGDYSSNVAAGLSMTGAQSLNRLRLQDERRPLVQPLALYHSKSCTEPRDAIYALLNIATPINIQIDYGKKLAEVYTEATLAIISHDQNLDLLILWDSTRTPEIDFQRLEFPSWVPKFGRMSAVTRLNQVDFKELYVAGGPLKEISSRVTNYTTLLAVDGCFFTTVSHVEPKNLWDIPMEDLMQMWSYITEIYPRLQIGDFWRTLLLDQYPLKRVFFERSVASRARFNAILEQHFADPYAVFMEIKESFKKVAYRKTFCVTAKENMAMVSGNVEKGDLIFVAHGSIAPFILRPVPHETQFDDALKELNVTTFYEFVGPAYVQGVMDGEVWDMVDGVNLKEEKIWLA